MSLQENLVARLKSAQQLLIARATKAKQRGETRTKADAEGRAAYLRRIVEDLEHASAEGPLPPRVFVSYSKDTGSDIYSYVTKKLTDFYHFKVISGFDRGTKDDGLVLQRVLNALGKVSMFVGILTKQYEIRGQHSITYAPSVWTIEEKGMALALRHSFVLLVENGVDSDYWKKTTPANLHFVFERDRFMETVDEALDVLAQKYNNRLELFLREP